MKELKKIILISLDRVISQSFTNQLNDILKNEVIIKSYLLEDSEIDLSDCDLVICSSKAIFEKVRNITPQSIKVIVVRRAINLAKLSEVISLRAGQRALVVSNLHHTAMETIDLLKELGIDYIDYIPYYPGAEFVDAEVAITAGGGHLVPAGIRKVIDLGVKVIDVSTIAEILVNLNLPLENTNILTARYAKEMISLNKYNGELNNMLKAMLDTSHDGILAVDGNGFIIFYNQVAKELLGISNENVISKNIIDIIDDKKLWGIALDHNDRTNEMISFNGRQLLVNKVNLRNGKAITGKVFSLKDVTDIQKLEYEVRKKLRNKGFVAKYTFKDIVGVSSALNEALNISKKIAKTDLTVLIQGENGTGKELFAQAIHNASKRSKGPFVAVNFAALSESLMESELFGYEEGAFTGAKRGGKPGLFEQAHTGTIFLDEIGDASLSIQARLLRVLQEKEVMRVGGTGIIPVDVRIIAATNRNIEKLVEAGHFRKDLYFRLKVLHFKVPSLRDRKEDIPYLIKYFLEKQKSKKYFDEEVMDLLYKYSWPGNIRELENLINYLISVVDSQIVTVKDLPEEFKGISKEGMKKDNLYKDIEESLKNMANVQEFVWILKELQVAKDNCLGVGRKGLVEKLKVYKVPFTEDKIRSRLKVLEEFNLVSVGKTRQGTVITDIGEMFLKYLTEKSSKTAFRGYWGYW